ncbi:MAG: hypothetical protein IPM00_09875 [Tetrasphaera sp.]|nr:hypothetical protein [Tetrasphaera sp.]
MDPTGRRPDVPSERPGVAREGVEGADQASVPSPSVPSVPSASPPSVPSPSVPSVPSPSPPSVPSPSVPSVPSPSVPSVPSPSVPRAVGVSAIRAVGVAAIRAVGVAAVESVGVSARGAGAGAGARRGGEVVVLERCVGSGRHGCLLPGTAGRRRCWSSSQGRTSLWDFAAARSQPSGATRQVMLTSIECQPVAPEG